MGYLKCVVIYLIMSFVLGIPLAILKYASKKSTFADVVQILVNLFLGGYVIYYLINIYFKIV